MKTTISLLVLFVASFIFSSPIFAKDTPPPEPKAEQIGTLSGFQFLPGWNYFSLAETSCPLETIFNELQADAGGGIYIDTLFAIPTKGTWTKYDYGKTDLLTVIPTGSVIAYESDKKFFFDMASIACSEEPKNKRTTQIAAARAVAQTNEVALAALEEEKNRKIRELQRVPSPLDPLKNWFADLWTALAKFFQKFSIK
ncbi:MAG: hypothetical protein AAB508_01550 [Patescibacteria group bacterium]